MNQSEQRARKGLLNSQIDLATVQPVSKVRVYRLSRNLKLDSEVQVQLRQWIARNELGDESSARVDEELKSKCELKMRQMVAADASWQELKPYAWQLFRLQGTSTAAAQFVEQVYIYGSIHDVCDVLAILNEEGYEFYAALHLKLREHLAYSLWKIGKTQTLVKSLIEGDLQIKFLPIEHFFFFWQSLQNKDKSKAFIYFQNYSRDIIDGVRKYGDKLDVWEGKFYLTVGRLALKLGFNDVATNILERINVDAHEYADALQMLMILRSETDEIGTNTYQKKLEREPNWRKKIELVRQFIKEARGRLNRDDIRRPGLNRILSDPLSWLPRIPICIKEISRLLAANLDLRPHMPGVLELFRQSALSFQAPAIDIAIWEGALTELELDNVNSIYWHGIARLHYFAAVSDNAEAELWKARKLINHATKKCDYPLPHNWNELHRAAVHAIARAPYFSEALREQKLRQLRVAADPKSVTLTEIEAYCDHAAEPPFYVLTALEKVAAQNKNVSLETRLILKRAKQTHLRNQDLNRLWHIHAAAFDFDMAWRVATILNTRKTLKEEVKHSWSISGEKRSAYPFFSPRAETIDSCLAGFSKEERMLCYSCLQIGSELPELLAIVDGNAKSIKVPQPSADSFEASVEKALNKIKWLPQQKKVYRFSYDGVLSAAIQLPGFIQVLPNNVWSYTFVRIAEKLGLNSWGWQLSRLHSQIEEVLPRIASAGPETNLSAKMAKWLKGLSPTQRSAWHDLVSLCKKIDDERGVEILSHFIARVTTVIHPAHYQALESLRTMRAPVDLIWHLESWLLSSEYSELRKVFQNVTRVPVPGHLARLSIV